MPMSAGLAKDAGASVVVLGMEIPPNYGARAGVPRDLRRRCKTHRPALVPFLLDGVATDEALMQADGIHPTAAAQERLLDNVWPALKSLL